MKLEFSFIGRLLFLSNVSDDEAWKKEGNNLNSIYENVLKFFENDNYKVLGKHALEFSKEFKWKNIVKKYLQLI